MTIGADAIVEFFGTPVALGATPSTVIDNAFSDGTNDLDAWTNIDDALYAAIALTFQYASGSLDGTPNFKLYAARQDVEGTNDEPVPSATNKDLEIGTFHIDTNLSTATNHTRSIDVVLPNTKTSQVYHFYIENQSGVTISTNWELTITPKAEGLHA